MSKHTPGPWTAEPHSSHEMAFLVTSTAPQSVGGDRTVMVAKFASRDDARLIAAAPCLLAALMAVEPHLYMATDKIRQAVRAAIAKAEGTS